MPSDPSKIEVLIRGGGVAALCCAHLLDQAGIAFDLEVSIHSGVPAILVGDATQSLIEDVFNRKGLFDDLPRIDKRVVAWGPGSRTTTTRILPHSAVVVSEQQLLQRLQIPPSNGAISNPDHWTIHAARPLPSSTREHHFGSRIASTGSIRLRPQTDRSACWIESLEGGWLFLIPGQKDQGWLIAVGDTPTALLESSQLISAQVEDFELAGLRQFPAYPRIADPLCESRWIACGAAAMAFDPICGDGTGNAVREAILATAVIRATPNDPAPDDLLSHYQKRLIAAFGRHLEQCRPFYATGHSSPWWREELEQLESGIAWCRAQLGERPHFEYRLKDFELERLLTGPRRRDPADQ